MARRKSDPADGGDAASDLEPTATEAEAGQEDPGQEEQGDQADPGSGAESAFGEPETAESAPVGEDAPDLPGIEAPPDEATAAKVPPPWGDRTRESEAPAWGEPEAAPTEAVTGEAETAADAESAAAAEPEADVATTEPDAAPEAETVAVAAPYHAPEVEEHEEEAGGSFASKVLTFLVLLLAGAALGIWAAPKVAPMLPSGMAPVAAWLTPGSSESAARFADLDTRLAAADARITDLTQQVPQIDPAEITANATDAATSAADAVETRLGMQITDLRDTLGQLDTSAIRQQVTRLQTAVDGQSTELAALKEQLGGAANVSSLSDEAVARIDVYRAELDGLRAELGTLTDNVSALSSRIDEVAATADRSIDAAQARVAEIEAQSNSAIDAAGAAVGAASATADVAQIRAALASGAPFSEPAERLAAAPDVVLPDALMAVAGNGVPTLADLGESFPDAALEAIRASILASGGEGLLGRATAFLEAQVASRSLAPAEGSGPDAVLSRMEASLRADDLEAVIDESAQLPSESAAAMSGWLDGARQRVAAEKALAELAGSLPAAN